MKRRGMLGMLITMLLVSSITVNAADNSTDLEVTKSTVQRVQSEFNVDENLLGGNLTVSIPANISLSYDEETDKLICNEEVSAKGYLMVDKQLEVSVSKSVTYINSESDNIQIVGEVQFGTEGKEIWTSEQLRKSSTELDSRPLIVSVDMKDVGYTGTYCSELIFNIEIVDVDAYVEAE